MSVKSRTKEKWYAVTMLFFAAVIAASGVYGVMTQQDRPKTGALASMESTGKDKQVLLAPVTVVDDEDKPVRLDDFKGQAVLVNLWATWCTPCIAELPSLDRLQGKLKDKNVKVVAISMDRDNPGKVKDFLKHRNVENLDFYWDRDRDIASRWSYAGLPTSYLLNRNGDVIARWDGPQKWDKGEVFRKIKAAAE